MFYLQSRGLSEEEAAAMIVNGFIEPVTTELPMEYAVELNRLIPLEMGRLRRAGAQGVSRGRSSAPVESPIPDQRPGENLGRSAQPDRSHRSGERK